MSRIAIVVQRCHSEVVGGSEALAWQYGQLLKDVYEVDIVTTTAIDAATWVNELPEGVTIQDDVNVRRFPVDIGRSRYWHNIHLRLLNDFKSSSGIDRKKYIASRWTMALQEEFIRHQGPYSYSLVDFLKQHWQDYGTIIFITYLFPTTYFGLRAIPSTVALLVPTLHNEAPAYLPAYRSMVSRARCLLWNTKFEEDLGDSLWGSLPGQIVGMAVDTELSEAPWQCDNPYLLYCGRVDTHKGCPQLFEYFMRYKSEKNVDLQLMLVGSKEMEIPRDPDIMYAGFISQSQKRKAMRGAIGLVMPSAYESLSLVTLEAMAQGAPVLVNGACGVLADHVNISQGGYIYNDYPEFACTLDQLFAESDRREEMGKRGRAYALERYSENAIRNALISTVQAPVKC
jgi:glycosyltransferase involved in cell wall biosynthesis